MVVLRLSSAHSHELRSPCKFALWWLARSGGGVYDAGLFHYCKTVYWCVTRSLLHSYTFIRSSRLQVYRRSGSSALLARPSTHVPSTSALLPCAVRGSASSFFPEVAHSCIRLSLCSEGWCRIHAAARRARRRAPAARPGLRPGVARGRLSPPPTDHHLQRTRALLQTNHRFVAKSSEHSLFARSITLIS